VSRKQRRVALLVAGCFFMEILDGTIVVTSAPQIGADLGVSSSSVSLVMTAYLVTVGALIPQSGWMASRFGSRRVFLSAIVIFTVASLGCALSTSLAMLVAMRVLQGVGAALMVPVGRLEVLAKAPKSELMRIVSFLVWPALLAPVLAPLAGGLITTYASWHWIFLINLPLGIVAFAAAWKLIEPAPVSSPPPLDRPGLLLTVAGLACLTYTAQVLAEPSPSWLLAAAIGGAAAALLLAAVRHLLRARMPLVNLRTLRIATFGASVGGVSVYWLAVGAMPFLLPLLFENVFGWSPVKAGAVLLVLFLGNVGIKPATTYLYSRFGFRPMLITTTLGLALTIAACALLTADTPLVLIGLVVGLSGVFRSIGLTGYNTMAFSEVPDEQMRDANTLAVAAQQLSIGLGIAFAAVALRAGEPLGELLPGREEPAAAYSAAFLIVAVAALIACAGALRLHPAAGDVLRVGRGRGPAQEEGAG
jgi:EmrB/QacA subfamily drug resistance transporter